MSEYTLTREFVRREFIFGAMEYSPRITELFDRWLAEELAEAWHEGYGHGRDDQEAETRTNQMHVTLNPYRQEDA